MSIRLYTVRFRVRATTYAPNYEDRSYVVRAYDAADAITQAAVEARYHHQECEHGPVLLGVEPCEAAPRGPHGAARVTLALQGNVPGNDTPHNTSTHEA